MLYLIASDIHGRVKRAARLQEIIASFQPEKIFLLGDYLYNGPRNGVPEDYEPLTVSEMLNAYSEKIIGVRGNCDSRVDDLLLHFPLEDARLVEAFGHRVWLYHGDDFSAQKISPLPGDYLFSGHTHLYVLNKENGFIRLNPGSISFPKNGNPATFATWDGRNIALRDFTDGHVIALLAA